MAAAAETKAPPRDHVRETLETLVFVIVLVLILQLFVLEAFVIPTGSMAETQYGNHKHVTCEQCRYQFPVNASEEAEGKVNPWDRSAQTYICPNCEYQGALPPGGIYSGDRVLVHKAMGPDQRGRVVVFKYPVAPQKKQQAQNYIKRCVGFGDETVAIAVGDLYVTTALKYPGRPEPENTLDIWQNTYMYNRDPEALALFNKSKANGFPTGVNGFELYRKSDELAMEMRRIVFDNDHQPADLAAAGKPRWVARDGDGKGWDAGGKEFTHTGDELGWIGYRHLTRLRDGNTHPQKITNTMGYNCQRAGRGDDYWVGDLMLECTAKLDAGSELTMELSKGEHRYQAVFADGTVTLFRLGEGNWTKVSRPTPIKGKGTYQLRFANFDCRLRVWVNDTVIDFGGEADYPPTKSGDKPVDANDIDAPAGIAAKGTATVSGLRLWRDTYYTPHSEDSSSVAAEIVETYYVHPGHYLCMGDNSAQSSDGRSWGVVPERLMIGRAVFTFWPAWPEFRVGVIR